MKKLLITSVSVLALGIAPALAENEVHIQQLGDELSATVNQNNARDSATFVAQFGDNDTGGGQDAEVFVTQADRGLQNGFANEAHVFQRRSDNNSDFLVRINQDHTRRGNDPNRAFAQQLEAPGVVKPARDEIRIDQEGTGNLADARQHSLSNGMVNPLGGNDIVINQDGDDNKAWALQVDSRGSTINVNQVGDENVSDNIQINAINNSTIDVDQFGDNNVAGNGNKMTMAGVVKLDDPDSSIIFPGGVLNGVPSGVSGDLSGLFGGGVRKMFVENRQFKQDGSTIRIQQGSRSAAANNNYAAAQQIDNNGGFSTNNHIRITQLTSNNMAIAGQFNGNDNEITIRRDDSGGALDVVIQVGSENITNING